MNQIYFFLFIALLLLALLPIIWKPALIFEYPHFMGAVFGVFILPQAVSLLNFPAEAPPEAVQNVLLMTCLCLGMCLIGYRIPLNKKWMKRPVDSINEERLLIGGLVFIAISYYFNHRISLMTEDETGGSTWTGIVTIYAFFSGLIYPGFAICFMTALRRPNSVMSWIGSLVGAILPIQAAIFAGRREAFILFALTLFLSLFYTTKFVPPRIFLILSIVGAMVAIPATGTYRAIASLGAWEVLPQLDLVDNFKYFLHNESILELRNGAMTIQLVDDKESLEWGRGYWDQLIFRFVPAQIVGKQLKDSLMFRTSDDRAAEVLASKYERPIGSTITGMGDSYQQFGYFGCLFFAIAAVIYRNLYHLSFRPGAVMMQLFYIQISTSAMRAVTHQTLDFLPGVAYAGIFLGLLWLFCRQPKVVYRRSGSNPAKRNRPVLDRSIGT